MSEPTNRELQNTLIELKEDIQGITKFIYGTKENPESAYIFRQEKRCREHTAILNTLIKDKGEREKGLKAAKKWSYAAVAGVVLSFTRGFAVSVWQALTGAN